MDKVVLSPSKATETPPEKTLKLLHERLDQAELEAKKLSEQLTEYGFNSSVQNEGGRGSAVEAIAPFEVTGVDEAQYHVLKKNYEQLVSRVCRTESTVQSLKLALVSLEAENSLMNRDSVAGALTANEAYEKELTKAKKKLVACRKELDESERFRAQTEQDFQRLREKVGVKRGSNGDVVEKVQELKVTREKLTKRVNELRDELSHEKNIRVNLESSHEELLERVNEMEQIVEKENQEMKLLSGDCGRLKHELSQTKLQYDKEYQTRIQLETLVKRLNEELEDMESKLLNVSNQRKALDSDLAKLKRDNKEHRQQLESLQKSNDTLKKVNLDLEERYKEASKLLRVTADDNKILVAQHRESVEKERLSFAEKLKEQDKLLDAAKESILQELTKEKEANAEKEKESAKYKAELATFQKLLYEKDEELKKLKDILEKLTVERDKMMEENDKAILEIRRDLDNFVSEKITLEAQLDERKVESHTVREVNEKLEDECHQLRTRLMELERQQPNQHRLNKTLQDMLEDKRRLAYEKGVLQAENDKLKRTVMTAEQNFHELQRLASDKEKEVQSLIKNKDEALKETERIIRQTDIYERKYSKKIDSLQSALYQSKEDNKKLASTLETVITSHTQLQTAFERLQTELGKRDSEQKCTKEERSNTETKIWELTREVESLQEKLIEMQELESNQVGSLRNALQVMEEDRKKLMNTVEPLMKTNKELQESLETLASELSQKESEIKKLRQSSLHKRKEMEIESVAKESRLNEIEKEWEKEMKEVKMKHKKEMTKARKEFQDLMNLKNILKEENNTLKHEKQEDELRQKKLKDKLRSTKNQLDQCLKLQATQEREAEIAKERIEAMSRELATLEHLRTEYTRNNLEQARSLQEFVSQLTELQEEFKSLSDAQKETSLLCRQKDEEINEEKLRRKEIETMCHKLKSREKQLRRMRNDAERQLEEVNFESQQVATNLQEAHEWFKNKFANLQSELNKSRKVQSVLQKDNVDQYKALQEERKRAEVATERAKEIIKSSRVMISKLVGQVEATEQSKEIQEAMAQNRYRNTHKRKEISEEQR